MKFLVFRQALSRVDRISLYRPTGLEYSTLCLKLSKLGFQIWVTIKHATSLPVVLYLLRMKERNGLHRALLIIQTVNVMVMTSSDNCIQLCYFFKSTVKS